MKKKSICVFICYLLLFARINTDINSIFNTIKQTRGYIFEQLRNAKAIFPADLHSFFENSIKEYEYRYLSNDNEFKDYVTTMYESLKNAEESGYFNKHKNELELLIAEISKMLYSIENVSQRESTVNDILGKHGKHTFYRSVLLKLFESAYSSNHDHFDGIDKILEFMTMLLSSGKTYSKDYDSDPYTNHTRNYTHDDSIHHKNIPDSFRVDDEFKEYIQTLHDKYKFSDVKRNLTYSNNVLHNDHIKGMGIEKEDHEKFSRMFHRYLNNSIINNDEFKEAYTINKGEHDLDNLHKIHTNNILDEKMKKIETNGKPKQQGRKMKSADTPEPASFLEIKEEVLFAESDPSADYMKAIDISIVGGFFKRPQVKKPTSIAKSLIQSEEASAKKRTSRTSTSVSEAGNAELVNSAGMGPSNDPNSDENQKIKEQAKVIEKLQEETKKISDKLTEEQEEEFDRLARKEKELQELNEKYEKNGRIINSATQSQKYKDASDSESDYGSGLIPLLLKPIMLILELLTKKASQTINQMSVQPVKDSISSAILANVKKRAVDERKKYDENTSGECPDAQKKLDNILKNQLDEMKKDEEDAKKSLEEVNPGFLENVGNPVSSVQMMENIVVMFLKKLIQLVITHVPFYFFKICLPPGPLTFGCCPEAAFYPEQLYIIFTVFEKIEKFKMVANAYPSWLAELGNEDFDENRYYSCAQGYLTLTESTLFNYCNFPTMVFIHPLNLAGMIPGDLPLCFWACLQAMIMCNVWIDKISECDALINLEVIIKAIFSIPNRNSLMMIFSQCTYIPFLIRWDLVPPWKRPELEPGEKMLFNDGLPPNDDDDPNGKPKKLLVEKNCADPKNNKLLKNNQFDVSKKDSTGYNEDESPFAKALINMDPNALSIINSVKKEVQTVETFEEEDLVKKKTLEASVEIAMEEMDDFGFVRRTMFGAKRIDIEVEEINPTKMKDGNSSEITEVYDFDSKGNQYVQTQIERFGFDNNQKKIEKFFPFHPLRIIVTHSEKKRERTVTGKHETLYG